ncbi:MAG: hypothetical protein NDJ89_14470 [Oligoflexia bacterium]|nr:hypothetical protein [Oligoflexia bacterium]
MKRPLPLLLALIPILAALAVWLSPLSFVPVPWPDDSAFYFVAKELFSWPPRWVMLPQAPFEPTYRIFNFNTMPLYPILIGLGRLVGIDGSFGLKFWPLSAWALSGSLLAVWLYRKGLPAVAAGVLALGFGLDPVLRWASVLVRPESLIGLAGMALVLGLTLGFPERFKARTYWDPIAALLAFAAYAHFNAVHLVFPVVFWLILDPRRLLRRAWEIGWKTALYLSPWIVTILAHPKLFLHQMTTQWKRLAVGNGWLRSVDTALGSLFESMGSPVPWPSAVRWAAVVLWFLIFAATLLGLGLPLVRAALRARSRVPGEASGELTLVPAAGWVLGSCWLWHSKPEVWFIYYIHLSLWCFIGVALLQAWRGRALPGRRASLSRASLAALGLATVFLTGIYGYTAVSQAQELSRGESWRWRTYYRLIDCIDEQLVALEARLGHPRPFRVWDPTFPDVTIELSRRHPEWEFTRTNDFWERRELALRHGEEVEAVVVPETLSHAERFISAPASRHPEIQSVWMNWREYFLHKLLEIPGWKPDRHICQQGRWQAFIYMKSPR